MTQINLLTGAATCLVLAALGCHLLLLRRSERGELSLLLRLFLVALAVRFTFSLLVYQGGLLSVLGDEDSSGWLAGARLHAEWERQRLSGLDLPSALLDAFKGQHVGFHYMLALLFFVLGTPERLSAAALNCFFGALTVVFIYRTARLLFSPWVASRAAWWACWFPSLIVWSALTAKEPVVLFLETVALYGCVRLRQRGVSARHLALCAAICVLLLPFRFYAAYVVGVAILLSLLSPVLFQARGRVASVALLALLLPVVAATGTLAQREARRVPQFNREYTQREARKVQQFNLDYAQRFRTAISGSDQGSGVRTEDIRTPRGLVLGVGIGAAHLLLAPFPWQLGGSSLRMLLTAPELLVWWWLFFAGVLPGLRHAVRHRLMDIAPLLVLLLGFGLLYALMFGNVGLVFRQRAQLLPWLLVFAAVGLEHRALRRMVVRKTSLVPPMLAEARP